VKYRTHDINVIMADPFFDDHFTRFYIWDYHPHHTSHTLRIRVPEGFFHEWIKIQRIKNFINLSVTKEIQ
jgi:hypothetical protein